MFKRLNPVANSQRAYVSSHPLGVWLAIGISVTGWTNLLMPSLVGESSASLIFSPLVLFLFNLSWTFGGTLSLVGLLRGKRRIEGAGMSLLASGMLSYYLAVVGLVGVKQGVTAFFVLALGLGCASRAFHLAHHGYVNLDVPIDQPSIK